MKITNFEVKCVTLLTLFGMAGSPSPPLARVRKHGGTVRLDQRAVVTNPDGEWGIGETVNLEYEWLNNLVILIVTFTGPHQNGDQFVRLEGSVGGMAQCLHRIDKTTANYELILYLGKNEMYSLFFENGEERHIAVKRDGDHTIYESEDAMVCATLGEVRQSQSERMRSLAGGYQAWLRRVEDDIDSGEDIPGIRLKVYARASLARRLAGLITRARTQDDIDSYVERCQRLLDDLEGLVQDPMFQRVKPGR